MCVIETLSKKQLVTLRGKIDRLLDAELKRDRLKRLNSRLLRISYKECVQDSWIFDAATPPSTRERFAGGFFCTIDGNKHDNHFYAKTKTGIIYRLNTQHRKWVKVGKV